MLSCLTAATNLDWTVYINSDMSSTTGPAGKHMPATFSAQENVFYGIPKQKKAFLCCKNKKFKKSKN